MNPLVLAIISGVGLLVLLKSTNKNVTEASEKSPFAGQFLDTTAGKQETTLDRLYKKYAARNGLQWELVKAVAIVESNENPNAVNTTDPSYGLMQVYCVSDANGRPTNKFNINGWPVRQCSDLLSPETNLHLACQILKWNIQTYGFKRGIAVYNRWASRHDPENGPFGNQSYVDKVLKEYAALTVSGGGYVV